MKKIITMFLSFSIFGFGGYEKQSLWHADSVNKAGVNASESQGSNSLQSNPALLHSGVNDVSFSFGTFGGTMKGPINEDNKKWSSTDEVTFSGGITGKYILNEKFAIGVGTYTVGGLDSTTPISFGNVDSDLSSFKNDYYAKLAIIEHSLGFGYKYDSNWSFGAALRGHTIRASFNESYANYAKGLGGYGVTDGTVLSASSSEIYDLKGSDFGTFRLGTAYLSDSKKWGVGVSYRSNLDANLTGKSRGTMAYTSTGSTLVNASSGGSVTPVVGNTYRMEGTESKVSSSLPQKISLDGHYEFSDSLKMYLGYTWVDYSKNKELGLKATLTDSLTAEKYKLTNQPYKWKDLHMFKVAVNKDVGSDLNFYGGYVLATQVTNDKYASVSKSPAGHNHTISAGISKKFKKIKYDFAIDHTFSKTVGSTSSDESASTYNIKSFNGQTDLSMTSVYVGVLFEF